MPNHVALGLWLACATAAIGFTMARSRTRRMARKILDCAQDSGWIEHGALIGRISPSDGTVDRWYRIADAHEPASFTLRDGNHGRERRLVPLEPCFAG